MRLGLSLVVVFIFPHYLQQLLVPCRCSTSVPPHEQLLVRQGTGGASSVSIFAWGRRLHHRRRQ